MLDESKGPSTSGSCRFSDLMEKALGWESDKQNFMPSLQTDSSVDLRISPLEDSFARP